MVERNDPNPESALDDNDHDDSYLSDDDWLTGKSLWTMPPQPPSKALWGLSSSRRGNQEMSTMSPMKMKTLLLLCV
jgi:hypothetical protein